MTPFTMVGMGLAPSSFFFGFGRLGIPVGAWLIVRVVQLLKIFSNAEVQWGNTKNHVRELHCSELLCIEKW